MRRLGVFLFTLFLPLVAGAAGFQSDLYFGLRNSPEVILLQEFLRGQNIYTGPVTGNFFSLTKEAVISFQKREKIEPSAGYFGPKSRSRANLILSGSVSVLPLPSVTVESLSLKIAELTLQLKVTQEKLAKEQAVVTPAVIKAPLPAPSPLPPPLSEVRVANKKTNSFPEIETNPWKIGEFTVRNDLGHSVLFTNFDVLLIDALESTPNRNQKINLILRDGPTAIDTQISKTEFTFILAHPKIGEPHKSILKFPFDVLLKTGEEKTVSLWVEQFKYVKSGTLEIKSTKTNTTDSSVSPVGSFDFILTREPPL